MSAEVPKPDNSVTIEAQMQRQADSTADQENRLMKAVLQKLRCAQATSRAQYNGWLAAAQLKMPECIQMVAKGPTILVVKFRAINVTFETEITKCGPQLHYKDYTLKIDGWQLIPFSKCNSQNAFINVKGTPYTYGNSSWKPIEIVKIRPREKLTSDFKYQDLTFSTIER